jgi:polar amino acid transport system ATP-binding protein
MKLKINNLVKKYDNKVILDNINVDIENTKVIGIIGKSGCGKSTLLRQLATLEDFDSGEIKINDIELSTVDKKKYRLEIGYVFQEHSLFPHLSVEDNIKLILEKVKKVSKEESKMIVQNLLNEFSLSDVSKKLPAKISGGQAQRASIVRALSLNPKLLFLDEPTSALDPLLTKEVLESIKKLKEKGMEFIFVTHEMAFLKEIADYYVFMDEGQIIESGKIENLKESNSDKLKKFIDI